MPQTAEVASSCTRIAPPALATAPAPASPSFPMPDSTTARVRGPNALAAEVNMTSTAGWQKSTEVLAARLNDQSVAVRAMTRWRSPGAK